MAMSIYILALKFLIIIKEVLCTAECINMDFYVTQNVEKNGFHRDVRWLIEMSSPGEESWLKSGCRLCMKLDITSAMFVNPDQIYDLNRLGQLSAYIEGTVDVEKAAHEADEHSVFIFLPNSTIEKVNLELPIHLRYQRGQLTGGFGKALLRKPSLLVYCPEFTQTCAKGLKVEAPCNVTAEERCIWKNLTYNSLFDEVELPVPVGDLDDYPIVSIVSLLLGCAGCIYILSVLSTRPL